MRGNLFRRAISFASGVHPVDVSAIREILRGVYTYINIARERERERVPFFPRKSQLLVGRSESRGGQPRDGACVIRGRILQCSSLASLFRVLSLRPVPGPLSLYSSCHRATFLPPSRFAPTTTIARALPFYAILHLFPATCGLASLSKCHLVDD